MGYRVVDTTADIGVEAWGKDLKELFEETARGLLSLMADTEKVRVKEQIEWETEGIDAEDTLISMLNDIIYLHETKRMVFKDVQVKEIDEKRVRFALKGERIDPERHTLNTEVKAATYHNIRIERKEDGFKTRVIFDL